MKTAENKCDCNWYLYVYVVENRENIEERSFRCLQVSLTSEMRNTIYSSNNPGGNNPMIRSFRLTNSKSQFRDLELTVQKFTGL